MLQNPFFYNIQLEDILSAVEYKVVVAGQIYSHSFLFCSTQNFL